MEALLGALAENDEVERGESGNAGGDDDEPVLRNVPVDEVGSVPGEIGSRKVAELNSLDGGTNCGDDTETHDNGKGELKLQLHLEILDNKHGEQSKDKIGERGESWEELVKAISRRVRIIHTTLEVSIVLLDVGVPAMALVGHMRVELVPEIGDGRALSESDDGKDQVDDEEQDDESPEEGLLPLVAVDHSQKEQGNGDLAEAGTHGRERSGQPDVLDRLDEVWRRDVHGMATHTVVNFHLHNDRSYNSQHLERVRRVHFMRS